MLNVHCACSNARYFESGNQTHNKQQQQKKKRRSINACANSKDMHFELKFIDYKT